MADSTVRSSVAGSAAPRWAARILVLGAFAVTVWLCGPRAMAVLAAKLDQTGRNSPGVALDRVGFVSRPDWLDNPLLLAMSAAVSPWLRDEVPILDEALARRLRDGLATVPWVRDASIERVFPDRFQLHLALRRPVLAVRTAEGAPLCLVDRDAVALPWVDTALPVVVLYREGGAPTMAFEAGAVVTESRVRAAAAIAVEWRDELAPLVAGCPPLLEVDATNLGERWLRGPSYPEVRVKLRRADGAGVVFAYGRPVDSPLARVPVRTKASVLEQILGLHPGLQGLVAGDLRLLRRWADYLQPRAAGVRDPIGPWSELPVPRGG
ncbi:MAG TPA: hypothetical protein VFZ65_18820 [Planctomycetota bacterium]|nr:hypothetical protein [Planctomycetota bacterium]